MHRYRLIAAVVGAIACSTAPLDAQSYVRAAGDSPSRADWTRANEFSMEPYVGVFLDGMVEDNGREMGPLLGVRLAFEPAYRLRLFADFGYSEVNGAGAVGTGASTFTYGNDWIFTMAGAEFDVVPGNTVGMIMLSAGVAWRKTEPERRVIGAEDAPDLGGFSSMTTIAPGVAFAHALSERAAVRFTVQDYIIDVDEDAEHSLAFSMGIVFR